MPTAREDESPKAPSPDLLDSWGGETDWNLIRSASGGAPGPDRERAWRRLVDRYRGPVKRVLMRQLRDDPAAEDATADFFGDLFQKQILRKADPDQGRFRCYIQGVIRRYALQWRRARQGSRATDVDDVDVGAEVSPEVDREEEALWAEAVLDHAIERLRAVAPRDAEILARTYGIDGCERCESDVLARDLNLTSNALDVARHRARAKLKAALLDELRSMVSSGAELDEERRVLVARMLDAHPGLLA